MLHHLCCNSEQISAILEALAALHSHRLDLLWLLHYVRDLQHGTSNKSMEIHNFGFDNLASISRVYCSQSLWRENQVRESCATNTQSIKQREFEDFRIFTL